MAEVSAANGYTVNRTFVWGPDFSNAQGQAGGAGSLLAQIDGTTGIGYAITDTFGTVVGYFAGSGTTATLKVAAEYTVYGKVIANYTASGASLAQYPIGHHGHYMDWETGLAYYGLRYYQPKHGRFINRDPIEEAGGNNLYAFVGNAPVNGWDVLGLDGGDGDPPIVLPPYGTTVPRERDPFTTHLGPSSGYWLVYSLNDWGERFVSTPSQVTHGSFIDPLTYLRRPAPNKSPCDQLRNHLAIAEKVLANANARLGRNEQTGAGLSGAIDSVSGVSATVAAGLETADYLYGRLDPNFDGKFWYNDTAPSFTRSGGGAVLSKSLGYAGIAFDAYSFGSAAVNRDVGGMVSAGASLATPGVASYFTGPMSSFALTGSNAGMYQVARFGGPMIAVTVGAGQVLINGLSVWTQSAIDEMEASSVEASMTDSRILASRATSTISNLQQRFKANGCK